MLDGELMSPYQQGNFELSMFRKQKKSRQLLRSMYFLVEIWSDEGLRFTQSIVLHVARWKPDCVNLIYILKLTAFEIPDNNSDNPNNFENKN